MVNNNLQYENNLTDSNIMTNNHNNVAHLAPHSTTINTLQQETTYSSHKSNYDVAYGTTVNQNDVQLLPQPATLLSNNNQVYIESRPKIQSEPIYAINQNGNLTIIGQQPDILHNDTMGLQNNMSEVRWRDPELEEVISFLSSPDSVIRANSVAYIQHLCFADDQMKQRARLLGGIPLLIDLLNRDILEVKQNVCGALRNLSYGRKNDDNKRAIRDASGIQVLVKTLIENPDNEIRELATSVLWNLSSCEDLKWSIIDDALTQLVSVILVPYTEWFKANLDSTQQFLPTANETHWSTVFRNTSGVLRNISSAGAYARKQLRDCDGLIESLFLIIHSSISRDDVDNKLVENCVCILRNLSYRCQETQNPDYDKNYYTSHDQTDSNSTNNSPSSPSSSANLTTSLVGQMSSRVTDNLGCFSFAKRAKSKSKSGLFASKVRANQQTRSDTAHTTIPPPHHPSNMQANRQTSTIVRTSTQLGGFSDSSATLPRSDVSNIPSPNSVQVSGKDLLWQADVVKPYLFLLKNCSNFETLEAAAGAIQNLAACYWQPSIDIRATVRKEKGLPVFVELLRVDRDRLVCVVATALRNLAIDQKNKDLIGIYGIPNLVSKLTTAQGEQDSSATDDMIAAILATIHEVISNNVEFVRSFFENGGLNRLNQIIKEDTKHSSRVRRFTAQVLLDMWKFTELREIYKKAGWKESHFIVKNQMGHKNSNYSVNSNTIERPISSQHGDRHNSIRDLRAISTPTMSQNMIQQVAPNYMNDANMNKTYDAYPAVGGLAMTNLNGQATNPHALYAQVDRQRKRNDVNNQQQTMILSNNC